MTGAELGMKRPDELQAFEEHLDGSVLDLPIGIIEQRPIELRVKPTAIRGNLLFGELPVRATNDRIAVESDANTRRG